MSFNAKREYNGMSRDDRVKLNCDILDKSGIDFIITPRGFYIPKGKPICIFYPSTGRWIVTRSGRAEQGGAEKFINWILKSRGGYNTTN